MKHVRIEREFAGRTLVLETGKLAKQADGAVLVTYGDTVVLTCIQSAKAREGIDFFPLTVDYREKTYAAGKFPGGFFKREARPTQKEILTCRLTDRPLRPMFPDGYKQDVQVMSTVLSFDGEVDPDVVSMIGAFAAVNVSSIPFSGPMGACRVGYVDGGYVINPSCHAINSGESELNLVLAATKDAVTMVEAGASGLSEDVIIGALEAGHDACKEVCAMIAELVKKAGKPKADFDPPVVDAKLDAELRRKYFSKISKAVSSKGGKHDRKAAVDLVKDEMKEFYEKKWAKLEADERKANLKYCSSRFGELKDEAERAAILEGKRTDGRGHSDIRPIWTEVGVLARAHGSAVFTRGETQALVVATLGTVDDEQIIDGLQDEVRKKFLMHYNFPPFSVGETRPIRGPGRREIGHGALAERSIEPLLPDADGFPYTIRLVSEILESNGSSSMATVCGSTLALMDAGVPIEQPVAGIAMGLVKEGRKTAILSDIQGSEDHCGDMDFKVAGTQHGITALQMDIKCKGLTRALLEKALAQAKKGRVHILKEMLGSLRRPRQELSAYAPRLVRLKIDPEKIGVVIGPGGKHIRGLQDETRTKINVTDEGVVTIAGVHADLVQQAYDKIEAMTANVEVGKVYKGKVVSIKEFGAFIEILPGQEGLCHVSELSSDFVRSVTDVAEVGDEIEVKVIDVDPLGKIKLSRKALDESGGEAPRGRSNGRPSRRRDRDDERPSRGRRGRHSDADEDEDDRPRRSRSRSRSRSRDDDESEDRPRRSRSRDDESEDRPRRSRSRSRDDESEDRPRRSRSRSRDDESEDRPRRSRSRSRDDDEPEERPRRSRRDTEDEDDRPRSRSRSRSRDDADEEDRPARGRGRSRSRDRDVRDDEEDRPRRGRGRGREERDPDSGDEDRPRRGRSRASDDEEQPRRDRDSSDEDRPRRGRGRARDDDDRPARRSRPRRSSRRD